MQQHFDGGSLGPPKMSAQPTRANVDILEGKPPVLEDSKGQQAATVLMEEVCGHQN
jgi:hypothetical protein